MGGHRIGRRPSTRTTCRDRSPGGRSRAAPRTRSPGAAGLSEAPPAGVGLVPHAAQSRFAFWKRRGPCAARARRLEPLSGLRLARRAAATGNVAALDRSACLHRADRGFPFAQQVTLPCCCHCVYAQSSHGQRALRQAGSCLGVPPKSSVLPASRRDVPL